MEHEKRIEQMEAGAEELEEHRKEVEQHTEEARAEWEAKKRDGSIPGAQPPADEQPEGGES